MIKKTVLILGASRYYLRAIQAAASLGCATAVADANADAPGLTEADYPLYIDISDVQAIVDAARRLQVDGVIPLNDYGVPAAAAVARELSLPGLSEETARITTDKALQRECWEKAGLPSLFYKIVTTIDEARDAVADHGRWPILLKPVESRGGASRGVSRVDCLDELSEAFAFAQSFYPDKRVLVEEYLDGSEHSVETVTWNGETHVLAVSDKVKTPLPYRVDKSVIYPSQLSEKRMEKLHALVRATVTATGVTEGAAHVELCYTSNGPILFEIGARCGGGHTPDPIVPYVTGIEMFKEVVRIALGIGPENLIPHFSKGCVYRFLTPIPGVLKSIKGLNIIRAWDRILDCGFFVSPGESVRDVRIGTDRSGFIVAGGETREEALALADRAEQNLCLTYEE